MAQLNSGANQLSESRFRDRWMSIVKGKNKGTLSLLLFLTPALLFYIAFLLIPAIGGAYYSLTDWNGLSRSSNFVGISNYVEALRNDPDFLNSLWFTLKLTVVILIVQNVVALFLAVMIESRSRGKGLFRTVFFMPNMVSLVVSAFMWYFIFVTVLPQLSEWAILTFLNQEWLGNPQTAFYSILIVTLWRGIGYMMIIYIAALQGVPKHLKEAAVIDGATSFQNFRHVTLPMIMHAITICLFLTLNEAFRIFDVVFALTGGGPGRSTQVIALNIYHEAFSGNYRFGYASAKAMILFFIVLVITVIQVSVMKRREIES